MSKGVRRVIVLLILLRSERTQWELSVTNFYTITLELSHAGGEAVVLGLKRAGEACRGE